MELDVKEVAGLILDRKIGFVEEQMMNDKQIVINQVMYALDLVRHRLDLKWGVGRLLEKCSPELRVKWEAQMVRLNDAVFAEDVFAVEELIKGCVRGLEVIEKDVCARGVVPFEVQFWEVMCSDGQKYRVVREELNSDTCARGDAVEVVSIPELVRVYHARKGVVFAANGALDAPNSLIKQDRPFEDRDMGF